MIDKIEQLKSIGKYRDFTASGMVNFNKLTVIYGDNGGGKTTLTSILRSLTNNDADIIKNRISSNSTLPQSAQIIEKSVSGNVYHTFHHSRGWNHPMVGIEIFDIHFINQNIYSGFDFNDGHRKQLHQFVIGAQGVQIKQQIEQNKHDKVTAKTKITGIENAIIQLVGNNLRTEGLPAFLAIPIGSAHNINQLITSAESQLTIASSNAIIQSLELPKNLSRVTSGIDFDSLIEDLQATSISIQSTALQSLFEQHCINLSGFGLSASEDWLAQGFLYVRNNQNDDTPLSCPFCKQPISGTLDIITAYTQKFDDEFNSLVQRLKTHLTAVNSFNIEAQLQSVITVISSNNSRISSWSTHLPNAHHLIPALEIDSDNLTVLYKEVSNSIIQKLQNPSVAISPDSINEFKSEGSQLNDGIDTYNVAIASYNNSITGFKQSIITVAQAQLELERLKRIKKRAEAAVNLLCIDLINEKTNLRTLETQYTQLSQQQETTATAFFSTYKDRINHYLHSVFRTPFIVDQVSHIAPQGRAMESKMSYRLTFDGIDISFDENAPNNVKQCLSEGDKSTLALAFFLSKIDIDPNVQDKILIIDDPLSSLDTNRRNYTVGIIKQLQTRVKQIVVLSHNEHFLYQVVKDILPSDKKSLRITENFVNRSSIIEDCDLEALIKDDYFIHIEALEEFRIHPNHSNKDIVLGWLRNVLEAHLKFKFYLQLRNLSPGSRTFGSMIRHLDLNGVVFTDNANRNSIIAKLHVINGVSWMPHHGAAPSSSMSTGINPHTITATELDNLILDTLQLINSQL